MNITYIDHAVDGVPDVLPGGDEHGGQGEDHHRGLVVDHHHHHHHHYHHYHHHHHHLVVEPEHVVVDTHWVKLEEELREGGEGAQHPDNREYKCALELSLIHFNAHTC